MFDLGTMAAAKPSTSQEKQLIEWKLYLMSVSQCTVYENCMKCDILSWQT